MQSQTCTGVGRTYVRGGARVLRTGVRRLRIQGCGADEDPVRGVEFSGDTPFSTFWQNEDMDNRRKLALLSRDPRAYAGSMSREPGEADPNGVN